MTEHAVQTRGLKDKYRIVLLGLRCPRDELYAAIDERVDRMFAGGAVAEARRLARRKLSKTAAMLLGLKEIGGYLRGDYSLEAATELLQMNTRRFAKRQLTWFRGDKRIRWFNVSRSSQSELVKKMLRYIQKN